VKTLSGLASWILALLLMMGIAGPVTRAMAAETDADAVKRAAARVNSAEAQLERAVFYELKTEEAATELTLVERAWFTEAGDWLKVSGERTSKGHRWLTEMWFGDDDAPVFMLLREEGPAPAAAGAKGPSAANVEGSTRVQEMRRFYNRDGVAIRELRKDAVFKAGEPLDTAAVKNVSRPVAKLPEEDRTSEVRRKGAEMTIEHLVKAGPPKRDPVAGAPGDSKRFRLIKGSISPDGRYAVAIGFAEAPKSWDDFYAVTDDTTDKDQYWIEDEKLREDLRNYVVDLGTHRIVGETGGNAFGTKTSFGRESWDHYWSPDSRWLVQVRRERWSGSALALAVDPEKGVVAKADLTEEATEHAAAFLKAKKDRTAKEMEAVIINSVEVTNEGTVTVELFPTQPGNRSFEAPTLIERFQVARAGEKVEAKFLDARYQR
jgi:hypothetical protein